MRARFTVKTDREHEVIVDLKWWGLEKYYVDGKLVLKKLAINYQGVREFKVGSDTVKIDLHATINKYHWKALLNNEIIVEDLFPDLTKRIEDNRQRNSNGKFALVKNLILWCLIAIIILSFYNASIKDKENTDCVEPAVDQASEVAGCSNKQFKLTPGGAV